MSGQPWVIENELLKKITPPSYGLEMADEENGKVEKNEKGIEGMDCLSFISLQYSKKDYDIDHRSFLSSRL